ncbi:hypothetical protein D1164_07635 [Mariniphaga sediminis]|uniref:Uncharacterized protein n=1 Tax=Mariniphaga sediminis TaxID=1628158 RepID=A0A399D0J1_9BACT|nr:hypothetical protein D1164_07635 [Mariniphaga sediminis]
MLWLKMDKFEDVGSKPVQNIFVWDSIFLLCNNEQIWRPTRSKKELQNSRKAEPKPHHLLLAFVANCMMTTNFRLCPGDCNTTNIFSTFWKTPSPKLLTKQSG